MDHIFQEIKKNNHGINVNKNYILVINTNKHGLYFIHISILYLIFGNTILH